ncbi:metallophosphoesterase family protein [Ligilactobacillus equi]
MNYYIETCRGLYNGRSYFRLAKDIGESNQEIRQIAINLGKGTAINPNSIQIVRFSDDDGVKALKMYSKLKHLKIIEGKQTWFDYATNYLKTVKDTYKKITRADVNVIIDTDTNKIFDKDYLIKYLTAKTPEKEFIRDVFFDSFALYPDLFASTFELPNELATSVTRLIREKKYREALEKIRSVPQVKKVVPIPQSIPKPILNPVIEKNIDDGLQILKNNSNVPKSWYQNAKGEDSGMIWHFTDINNFVNVMQNMAVMSKNMAVDREVMKNDNASSQVNDNSTSDWVHDYARFYLRPKTPTQYRNEGIFLSNRKYTRFDPELNAHLPIPIFIGFDLKEALLRNKVVVQKQTLARSGLSKRSVDDLDLSSFKDNVKDIYETSKGNPFFQHTEVIAKEKFSFTYENIEKIVVRTYREKQLLLTALAENDLRHFSEDVTKGIWNYYDKIVVDSDFFYNNGSNYGLRAEVFEDILNNKKLKPIERNYYDGVNQFNLKVEEYSIVDVKYEEKYLGHLVVNTSLNQYSKVIAVKSFSNSMYAVVTTDTGIALVKKVPGQQWIFIRGDKAINNSTLNELNGLKKRFFIDNKSLNEARVTWNRQHQYKGQGMTRTRIAILSDIHGNETALNAVVGDIRDNNIDKCWYLGDTFLPGPGGDRMWETLTNLVKDGVFLMGNWENLVVGYALSHSNYFDKKKQYHKILVDDYLRKTVSDIKHRICPKNGISTEETINGTKILLAHYLPTQNYTRGKENPNFQDYFANSSADIMIHGHTHEQGFKYFNNKLVLDIGSVGRPYAKEGWKRLDRRAQYMIIEIDENGQISDIEFRRVWYDLSKEEQLAYKSFVRYDNNTNQIIKKTGDLYNIYSKLLYSGLDDTMDRNWPGLLN